LKASKYLTLAKVVQECQLIVTVDLVHLKNEQTLKLCELGYANRPRPPLGSVFAASNVKIQKPFLKVFYLFPTSNHCFKQILLLTDKKKIAKHLFPDCYDS
jgi:hypothetical protein